MKQDNIELRKQYTVDLVGEKTSKVMNLLIDSLEQNFSAIDPAWETSLTLLAMNYQLLFAAFEDLQKNGKAAPDCKNRLQKNPSIGIFLNTQNAIQSLLAKMGLTLLSKARAKQLMKDELDTEDDFDSKYLD